jgi:hypothetical protein
MESSFKTKRERYSESNIVLTRELSNYEQWTEAEIRERGKLLAREAAEIWIGPKEQVARPEQDIVEDDEAPGRRELRAQFWTALNDYFVAEHPTLPTFEPRPSWTIRLPSGVRHIGIDLRFSLRHHYVGIDLWFWREESLPIWQRLSASSQQFNELLNTTWEFEQVDGRSRARMFISLAVAELRNESSWPDAQRWFGEKLSTVYDKGFQNFVTKWTAAKKRRRPLRDARVTSRAETSIPRFGIQGGSEKRSE